MISKNSKAFNMGKSAFNAGIPINMNKNPYAKKVGEPDDEGRYDFEKQEPEFSEWIEGWKAEFKKKNK